MTGARGGGWQRAAAPRVRAAWRGGMLGALLVLCASAAGCGDDASDGASGASSDAATPVTSAVSDAAAGGGSPAMAPPRHVVLVVLDGVRVDHTGVGGHDRPTTPNLDTLAADGVWYERAYAASSLVSQSLSALWTGRLPSSGGAVGLAEAQPHEDLPSLPRVARHAGFRTGFVSNQQALWFRGFTRGFDELEVDSVNGRWAAPEVTARALDMVDGWDRADASRPSLLVVDFADAREPHLPVPGARALMDAPVTQQPLPLDVVRAEAGALPADLVDSPGFRDLVARYDAEIAMVDDQLGALVSGLQARGRLEHTLLVVTSSHGVEFLEHGYVGSGWTLHEEVLRVPLVVWAPQWLAPARVREPVSHVDLLPSLAAVYGLGDGGARYDGHALWSTTGAHWAPAVRDADVLAELVVPELSILRAAIRGDHKLVQTVVGFAPGERLELARAYTARVAAMLDGELTRPDPWGAGSLALYDLAADPGERVDVRDDVPQVVERLSRVLERFGAYCRDNAPQARAAARVQQVGENAETLQQLGYL